MKLLTPPGNNPKLAKGMKKGYLSWALHLAPADLSGFEVCPMRTAGCTAGCLNTAGRGRFDSTQAARKARTLWFFESRRTFMQQLVHEISAAVRHAEKRDAIPCFRLNATSDIPWERVPVDGFANIFERFPTVQFYDYTKIEKRIGNTIPENYDLTFSHSENNAIDTHKVLLRGHRVAVVFRDKATVKRALVDGWLPLGSWPMTRNPPLRVDGDDTDLRFLDVPGIVALYAKGKAKQDTSGFVQDI